MKKILVFLAVLFMVGKAWALPDYTPSQEYSSSKQVYSSNVAVCNVVVTGVGVTLGDYIKLIDSSTGYSSTAPVRLTVTAGTVNFTSVVPYGGSPCNLFTSGLYVDESKSSGTLTTDVQILNAI